MNYYELWTQIWQICLVPLFAALTAFVVKYLNAKSQEVSKNINNATAEKYIEMINNTITKCVIATNQTYVNSLKEQGKFDVEAQKKAFKQTYEAVISILSEDAKQYIKETTNDLNTYLTQLIEAEVNKRRLEPEK